MDPGETEIRILYAFGVAMSVALLRVIWTHRDRTAAVPLLCYIVTGLLYNGIQLLNATVHGVAVSRVLYGALIVVIALSMAFLIVFALEYTGRERLVRWEVLAVLSIHPLAVTYFALVNPGSVFYESIVADPTKVFGVAVEYGVGAQIHAIYTYVLIVAATLMFVELLYRTRSLYRGQSAALVVGVLLPGTTTAFTLGFDLSFDLTPIGILITCGLFTVAIVRYRLIDLVPIARNRVLDTVSDAIFVIDRENRLIDANPVGRALFEDVDHFSIGRDIEVLLRDFPPVLETYRELTDDKEEREREVVYAGEHYRVRTTPIEDGRERHVGWLVLVQDITERKRREVQLERQNERLDQFASIVSHDLRNPLNVADGYVDLAMESGDTDYLEAVGEAHDRIDAIIEDVLALAREGKSVTDPREVDLAGLAKRSWSTVDTGDAVLTVETDGTISADPDRAGRLLENLFRNSVEHGSPSPQSDPRSADTVEHGGDPESDGVESAGVGSPDVESADTGSIAVEVTVGLIPPDETMIGGFYVEDDGVGIPAESREQVLEHGFTTTRDGTGFGLGIVQQIAEAHGWTVTVEESESGGARFVFSDVAIIPAPDSTKPSATID